MQAKLSLLALMLACLVGDTVNANATDLYVSQQATGLANGQDCANPLDVTHFNTLAYWVITNPVGTQIGPGTTVHLCGTLTTALSFQGSGTSGNPITLLFEPGAALNAPYWGTNSGSISQAAINVIGQSYIVINGQNTGSISATANGTSLTYQNNSAGIYVSGGSNVTVENLAISNMYVHVANSSTSGGNAGNSSVGIQVNQSNSFTAAGNTIHDATNGIFMGYASSTTGFTVSGNTIYNCNWGIASGDNGSNSNLSGVNIYGNTIHDASNWDDTNDDYHHNGIYFWAVQGGSNVNAPNIYNNYIYGNMNQCSPNSCATGWISLLIGGSPVGTFTSPNIFNNVLVSTAANSYAGNGFITFAGSNALISNNTIIGFSKSYGIGIDYGPQSGATLYNNIIENFSYFILVNSGSSLSASDYNDFYNLNNGFQYQGTGYGSLAAWNGGTGFDANSITSNPKVNSSYQLSSGSAAIGAAANLYSVCNGQPIPGLGALCYDLNGVARPATGNWSMGAYAIGSTHPPAPPTGLTAVISQ